VATQRLRASAFAPPHLDCLALASTLVPLFRLALHVLAVRLRLIAALDQQLRVVARAAQVPFEILPAAVGLKSAAWLGTSVGPESLGIL
jgi:hypothetical protein